ncbi:hypothetical protein J1N35_021073 [Gossypium stocksii]|uniref:Uncharacterized protein n=1 Tax=Gossypium stocksii TaxID=47602 RepID=A0A9D3VFS5_9ROSI|nr:hypothetical protein J1N35_021073 [Gossypium stocksii]
MHHFTWWRPETGVDRCHIRNEGIGVSKKSSKPGSIHWICMFFIDGFHSFQDSKKRTTTTLWSDVLISLSGTADSIQPSSVIIKLCLLGTYEMRVPATAMGALYSLSNLKKHIAELKKYVQDEHRSFS